MMARQWVIQPVLSPNDYWTTMSGMKVKPSQLTDDALKSAIALCERREDTGKPIYHNLVQEAESRCRSLGH